LLSRYSPFRRLGMTMMFDLRVPASLANLPGRAHRMGDEPIAGPVRTCSVCKQVQPETAFYERAPGKYLARCRACMIERANRWNKANRDRINERRKARKAGA